MYQEYITSEQAAEFYSVVVNFDGSVDADGTSRLRDQKNGPAVARTDLPERQPTRI